MKQQPLTPQSVCNGPSPLDYARAEIARLHKEITRLKHRPEVKQDVRLLDVQLRARAYRKYIVEAGLMPDFQSKNPSP